MMSLDPAVICEGCGAVRKSGDLCQACLLELALPHPSDATADPLLEGLLMPPEDLMPAAPTAFARIERAVDQATKAILPREFDGFTLNRQIATGGMGVVFEARQRKPDRRVALKMMRFGPFATAAERARFQIEVTAVARLDHPNIVPVYSVGEHEGHLYFTMKLYEHGSLAERLGGRTGVSARRIPPIRAARLIATIARAVHHAHQHGILHRDLKPSNILLDADGEPHLVDFGLAKLDINHGYAPALTLSTSSLGTPEYMAPEQASGRARDATTATDVWGLGAILYHLITGHLPFPGDFPSEIIERARTREPIPPSRRCREIGRDLEAICLRCLEKSPAQRYAGAESLAEDLERYLRGEPVIARPVRTGERCVRWARRNPRFAALGTLAGLLILAAVVGISQQWRRAERARAMAEDHSYFATIANVLAAREHNDFGEARRLLAGLDPARRGFEWRLLTDLCRGDERFSAAISQGSPQSLAWWPESGRFAVLTDAGHLDLFDPQNGTVEPTTFRPSVSNASPATYEFQPYRTLSVAPGGRHIALAAGNTLYVVESNTGNIVNQYPERLSHAAWLDDHRLVLGWNSFDEVAGNSSAWILDLTRVQVQEDRLPPDMSAPLAVSPDRQLVALAQHHQGPYTVRVWRTDEFPGVPFATLAAPSKDFSEPSHVALSGDNRFAAVAWASVVTGSKEIAVYPLAGGAPVFKQRFRFPINGFAFSPVEPVIAVVGDDSVIRTFRFLEAVPDGATYDDEENWGGDAVGPTGAKDPPEKMLTRSAENGRSGFLLGHEGRVRDVAFSADGDSLVTAGDDGLLRVWPKHAKAPGARISNLDTTTYSFHPTCSANGRWVLVRRNDHHGWWWDRATGRLVDLGEGQLPLAVLSDGKPLTFSQVSGEVALWNCEGVIPRQLWKAHGLNPDLTRSAVLSPDERSVIGVTGQQLFSVDLTTGTLSQAAVANMNFGGNSVTSHAVSPNGLWVAITALGPHTQIRPARDLSKIERSLGAPQDYDTVVAFHPDGLRLFVGHEDGSVKVFSTENWQELPRENFQAQRGAVTGLAISQDGQVLATSGDETLKLWNAGNNPTETRRRRRLELRVDSPRNWIRFADHDRVLLHSAENYPLEAWAAPKL
ncbi:MAG TPA: serine/threonine-protein kinase [Verrucomicrobiota bacterium]|nr:hypothetical protein [Verrucomicrobiales bacterium]HRI12399.1 serine/threonine-protein kinase [Verrucomicrobiota bacterium]